MYELNVIVIRNREKKKYELIYKVKNITNSSFIIKMMTSKYDKYLFNIIFKKNKNEPIMEFVIIHCYL